MKFGGEGKRRLVLSPHLFRTSCARKQESVLRRAGTCQKSPKDNLSGHPLASQGEVGHKNK